MYFKYKKRTTDALQIALIEADTKEQADEVAPKHLLYELSISWPLYVEHYYWDYLGNGIQKWTKAPLQTFNDIGTYAEHCRKETCTLDIPVPSKGIMIMEKGKEPWYLNPLQVI